MSAEAMVVSLVVVAVLALLWICRAYREVNRLRGELQQFREMVSGNLGTVLADPNAPEALKEWARGVLHATAKAGMAPAVREVAAADTAQEPEAASPEPEQECCGNSDWPCGGPRL